MPCLNYLLPLTLPPSCSPFKMVFITLPGPSPVTQKVKNPPAVQETRVQSLGWEDPLEKAKATHSSILAWRTPWTTVHGVAESQTLLSDCH